MNQRTGLLKGPAPGKVKNSKGLKALSLRVRNIVFEKKKTTYKEVAEILIDETKSTEPLSKKLNVSI